MSLIDGKIELDSARKAQFERLFEEFIHTFPTTPDGQAHLTAYATARGEARANMDAIRAAEAAGEDITDLVLAKLLPHADTEANREAGRWICIAPAFNTDVRIKYEAAGWTQPEDWPKVARAIFDFVRRGTEHPTQLEEACDEFAALPYTTGFQTGTLTPILNALRPDDFLLINNKSRETINYFADTSHGQKLREYPATNATGGKLIHALMPVMHQFDTPDLRDADLFDMFSHWLVAVKDYTFGEDSQEPIGEDVKGNDTVLALPFSNIFANQEEATWAFDFLRDAMTRLGVSDPNDRHFALTLRHNNRTLRLNYGSWAVLQFYGSGTELERVGIAFFDDQVTFDETIARWEPFATQDDQLVRVYELPIELARNMPDDVRAAYEATFSYIAERFSNWAACPFRRFNQPEIAEAIFDESQRSRLFSQGIKASPVNEEPFNIWWVNQGATLVDEQRGEFLWAPLQSKGGRSIYYWDLLDEVQEGDVVLHYADGAVQCVSQVQASAVIAEKPHASVESDWEQEGRLVRTSYHELRPPVSLKDFAADLLDFDIEQGPLNRNAEVKQGYLFRLTPEALDLIVDGHPDVNWPAFVTSLAGSPTSGYFTARTFELLSGLHQNPTKDFYIAHKEEFKTHLKAPFKQLLRDVIAQLPPAITDVMETEKRLFSRILKNDYGQGGAWDFYWGALYPKGGKRTTDAQLSLWIYAEKLGFSFYLGEYGTEPRERFLRNCQKYYAALIRLLRNNFTNPRLIFGYQEGITDIEEGTNITWQEWLRAPDETEVDAALVLTRQEVLRYSAQQLRDLIAQTYQQLFPLVLLALHDDPLPAIRAYLNWDGDEMEEAPEPNPIYTLDMCIEDTFFTKPTLQRWVRAIERKKQAIFYGPPGTGKTYLAEHLARHLISEGDGFVEVVQFHPAYAYEDFIQGLRPEPGKGAGLRFKLAPGRFLDFCRRARMCEDRCVLIIDEINRANLSRVFGELMYLLEYRERTAPLAAGGEFQIPENVRIIGTMNTADRSIALVDHALRRRFAFLALYPDEKVLRRYHQHHPTDIDIERLIDVLRDLNQQIDNRHYAVGITFFMDEDLDQHLVDIWQMEIEPYLEEYFFDQPEKVEQFRWDKIQDNLIP